MLDSIAGSIPGQHGPIEVHLQSTTKIEGVVLPTRVAVALGLTALFSALVLIVCLFVLNSAVASMTREIRALQIYEQDVENVLIRANLASRPDFAPRPSKGE